MCVCVLPWQKDHERLEKLNAEMQRMEERLQEERMERVKLEVELGREKDCNRVRKITKCLQCSMFLVIGSFCHLTLIIVYFPRVNVFTITLSTNT